MLFPSREFSKRRNCIFTVRMTLLRTISAFALAFLVMISSSSFMVGIHFCKGELKHLALLTKAEGCEKEKKLPPCHKHLASPCCDDEQVIHEGEGFKATFADVSSSPAPVSDLELPLAVISEIIPDSPSSKTQYYNYDPPLRSSDLTVAHRVLLI